MPIVEIKSLRARNLHLLLRLLSIPVFSFLSLNRNPFCLKSINLDQYSSSKFRVSLFVLASHLVSTECNLSHTKNINANSHTMPFKSVLFSEYGSNSWYSPFRVLSRTFSAFECIEFLVFFCERQHLLHLIIRLALAPKSHTGQRFNEFAWVHSTQ